MFINQNALQNSYNIELTATNTATATQYQFPDIPYLRNKLIVGIVASQAAFGVNTGKSNLFYAANSFAATYPCFVSFQDGNGDMFIQNMPICELMNIKYVDPTMAPPNVIFVNNNNGMLMIQPRIIVFPKCFVYFPTAPGIANACLQFSIFYQN